MYKLSIFASKTETLDFRSKYERYYGPGKKCAQQL